MGRAVTGSSSMPTAVNREQNRTTRFRAAGGQNHAVIRPPAACLKSGPGGLPLLPFHFHQVIEFYCGRRRSGRCSCFDQSRRCVAWRRRHGKIEFKPLGARWPAEFRCELKTQPPTPRAVSPSSPRAAAGASVGMAAQIDFHFGREPMQIEPARTALSTPFPRVRIPRPPHFVATRRSATRPAALPPLGFQQRAVCETHRPQITHRLRHESSFVLSLRQPISTARPTAS